jgi:hypothetical protein
MTQVQGEERVRLMQDVAELGLHRGDVGLVCGTWFEPSAAFEVEFRLGAVGGRVRALLMPNQVQKDANGDIPRFPEEGFGPRRLEHWENAVSQGEHGGRNMAGAREPFTYIPFFFSDLFEFGYQAVGDIDGRLTTFADWQEENKAGVIYYRGGDRRRGAMMCKVWGEVDEARALIQKARPVSAASLRGAIQ